MNSHCILCGTWYFGEMIDRCIKCGCVVISYIKDEDLGYISHIYFDLSYIFGAE